MLINEVETVLRNAPSNARVIVNDRADVARLVNAGGVHLGQDDLPPSLARMVLFEEQVMGLSTHDLQQAMEAEQAPVDYVAAGPVFPTTTKENASPALGLERLREICSSILQTRCGNRWNYARVRARGFGLWRGIRCCYWGSPPDRKCGGPHACLGSAS